MSLTTHRLAAGYPSRGRVLSEVDVEIRPGHRTALLGANGCGKTTLLACLSGAIVPEHGDVVVDGAALRHNRRGLIDHRRRVQLVLQDPDDQLFSADVSQDVSFGPLNLGLTDDEAQARVAEALELLGVTHLAARATHQLSYGEKKRVAVAGAVAMRPDYLLLDEPTAGLDPDAVEDMLTAITRLEDSGTTVIMATHDVDLALAWATTAIIVTGGRTTQGPVEELLGDDDLVRAAHLRTPWPLDLAKRLGWSARPRGIADVADLLAADASTRAVPE
ncbi:energy-coupling factor ABC transporter ATP-binding protein [Raineyella sp.]|uniref:energy-coupling factor ABC transporter ATP-binding protein n=1 Tax=Raineyella sp. TaxID=1911550 RepID=UPI002B215AD5|nr:ATP-binding cassette domain-containing protein [Raineyella sp.]MEA5154931.1 ATP-binding cassette domain-containing protein [Raineyella sp.]